MTDRRTAIAGLGAGLLLPAALLAAKPPKPGKPQSPGALLLPLSGPRAALGGSMARAAALALADTTPTLVPSYDTQGTAAGAHAAALSALRKGAPLLLGPLLADEAKSALTAAGAVPLLTFSNDDSLRGAGAFLLGITPSQLIGAILDYARRRGVRRVALLARADSWSVQCVTAARRAAVSVGVDLAEVADGENRAASATVAALEAGGAPDAVLLPSPDQLSGALAAELRSRGVQPLGLLQALDYAPGAIDAHAGAWFAAPDPTTFGDFSARYESVHGSVPGIIAALAYDAVGISRAIAASGQPARSTLLSPAGFRGVTGALRFRTDGSASRGLAILTVANGGYHVVATSIGA